MTDTNETNDDVKLEYENALVSVDHRRMNASGDGHPLGEDPLEWEVADTKTLIKELSDDMYSSWEATIREYIANAETACLKVKKAVEGDADALFDEDEIILPEDDYQPLIEITWNKQENKVIIKDNGIGMASVELDQIFRMITRSASANEGGELGNFGMGALSFVQLEGEADSMLLVTHSRQNDDNYAADVSLAGPEPIIGQLGANEYGTKFEMTPKNTDWNIRTAVERYAEFCRVPVRYTELDGNGAEAFNEDYGGKTIEDEFTDEEIMAKVDIPGAVTAIGGPNADNRTLLLSMPIERGHSLSLDTLDTDVDIQIHDESGKVFVSTNGHEGKIPVSRSQYEAMLVERTDGIISEGACQSNDVLGQTVESGPNEGRTVLADDTFDERFPSGEADGFIPKRDVSDDDVPGETTVIEGPNAGRTVLSEEEWSARTSDLLDGYVPEDELESFDVSKREGDLTLPRPKSDRDSLQEHPKFWAYIEDELDAQVEEIVNTIQKFIEESDNPRERLDELDEEDIKQMVP